MPVLRPSTSSLSCWIALAGCAASPGRVPDPEYTLVVLQTGPRTGLPTDERQKLFQGHFANMERLARAGSLVLAGPYGQQRSDPALRGLFVLDTADRQQAANWANSDPGVAAGVFRCVFASLATSMALRAQLAADLAAQDAIVASGRTPIPGEGGRGYVWLTAANGDAALAALAGHPAVLLPARLEDGRAFVLLDAKDLAAAGALVEPLRERLGDVTLDEWFGSGLLVDLPRRPHH